MSACIHSHCLISHSGCEKVIVDRLIGPLPPLTGFGLALDDSHCLTVVPLVNVMYVVAYSFVNRVIATATVGEDAAEAGTSAQDEQPLNVLL